MKILQTLSLVVLVACMALAPLNSYAQCGSQGKLNPNKAFLGVIMMQEQDEDASEQKVKGVGIREIVKESSAAEAGLKAGDVIIAINGQDVANPENLIGQLGNYKVGDEVTINLVRDGQNQRITTTLKARKEYARSYQSCGSSSNKTWKQNKTAYKNTNKVLLGVYTEGINEGLIESMNLKSRDGLVVTKLVNNSAAAEGGIVVSDIITKVDKEKILSRKGLIEALSVYEPGDKAKVKLIRDGKKKTVKVVFKERQEETSCNTWKDCDWSKCCPGMIKDVEDVEETRTETEDALEENEIEVEVAVGEAVEVLIDEPANNELEVLTEIIAKDNSLANKTLSNQLTNVENLSFSPNPNRGQFNINFFVPKASNTQVRIVDISGSIFFQENLSDFSGNYSKQIDISNKVKGLYLLQIVQDDKMMAKKISVQ